MSSVESVESLKPVNRPDQSQELTFAQKLELKRNKRQKGIVANSVVCNGEYISALIFVDDSKTLRPSRNESNASPPPKLKGKSLSQSSVSNVSSVVQSPVKRNQVDIQNSIGSSQEFKEGPSMDNAESLAAAPSRSSQRVKRAVTAAQKKVTDRLASLNKTEGSVGSKQLR